jgi:hypothetical protein
MHLLLTAHPQASVTTLQEGTTAGTVYYDGAARHDRPVHSPAWVLVYASAADITIDMTPAEARAAAAWLKFIPSDGEGREEHVVLPDGVVGEVVRVQLVGEGQVNVALLAPSLWLSKHVCHALS